MLAQIFSRKKKKVNPFLELNSELAKIGSSLRVNHRVISEGNRECQIFGSYIDFRENGMKWYGVSGVKVIHQALLVDGWVGKCLSSEELEVLVPGLEFPVARKQIEMGERAFLSWYWENLRNRKDNRFGELIELFASHELTRNLMSYFESRDFGFSSNIGEVNGLVIKNLPQIRITDDWQYEVHLPNMSLVDRDEVTTDGTGYIGRGTAREVFELTLKLLPRDAGPAEYFRCNGCPPAPDAA